VYAFDLLELDRRLRIGNELEVIAHAVRPVRGFAPQHVELMSKDKDLSFQRSPRPEQSDQGAPDQPAKITHRE
jgi:hypothetical protein